MLTELEKKEMLEDGRSIKRRKQFAEAKKRAAKYSEHKKKSLDEYISFLTEIQKVFPFKVSRKKTITRFNKL